MKSTSHQPFPSYGLWKSVESSGKLYTYRKGECCFITNKEALMKRFSKRVAITAVAASLLWTIPTSASANQSPVKSYPVSSGVTYSQHTQSGNNYINHLSVNLGDSYTKLDIGMPAPIAKTQTTTALANRDSREGNRVVGAINASFFDMKNGLPMYLISKNNQIINGGVISKSPSYYVSQPIAFGITKDGLAEIESYKLGVNVQYKGADYELTGINRERQNTEAIIFTPQHHNQYTNSNKFGFEVAIETDAPVTSTEFGQKLEGKVVKIRQYASEEKLEIPKNGFVLSVNGQPWYDKFAAMQIGEPVSVSLSINQKWMDSEFMLASGPMLLKDGKRNITMDTKNYRATAVTARTAVAISKDKKQVHLVTVDNKKGYSKGMTLIQFADYLAAQGYDRALNLDGGGSTAMGIRNYGSNTVVLANRTTGAERKVSAVIQAISTAALSEPARISITRNQVGTMLVGSKVSLKLNYVLDTYYNPLAMNTSLLEVTSTNGKVAISGLSYSAVQAGEDQVLVKYGAAKQSIPVVVVDAPTKLTISPATTKVKPGDSVAFKATATDAQGKAIIYSPEQLKWSVTGDIGTITPSGSFKAASKAGQGTVSVTLGTKTTTMSITTGGGASAVPTVPGGTSVFTDVPANYMFFNEISYLNKLGYIRGDNGKFNPGHTLSRQHAAVILGRALSLDTSKAGTQKFKDVPTSHSYFKEINAIANANLVGGKGDGTFDPAGELTRAQMAAILVKAYKLSGQSTTKFKDVRTDHWAYKQIQTLAYNKVTTGDGKGNFSPNNPINRGQFSAFLYRSINL